MFEDAKLNILVNGRDIEEHEGSAEGARLPYIYTLAGLTG